jgi:nicotinamidase-related amidase
MCPAPARHLLTTLRERILPAHTAVLVVDMQNDYVSPGGATDQRQGNVAAAQAVIPATARLLRAAREAGALVVYIKMTMDAELRTVSDVEYLRRVDRWGDLGVAVKGTWGHEVCPELAPQKGDLEVEKFRSSGFTGTNLDQVLRSNGIRSTIVTGVVTHGCVDSTARDAMLYDYYLTIARDCVASPNREQHEASLFLLERRMQLPDSLVTADRIIAEWKSLAGGEGKGS